MDSAPARETCLNVWLFLRPDSPHRSVIAENLSCRSSSIHRRPFPLPKAGRPPPTWRACGRCSRHCGDRLVAGSGWNRWPGSSSRRWVSFGGRSRSTGAWSRPGGHAGCCSPRPRSDLPFCSIESCSGGCLRILAIRAWRSSWNVPIHRFATVYRRRSNWPISPRRMSIRRSWPVQPPKRLPILGRSGPSVSSVGDSWRCWPSRRLSPRRASPGWRSQSPPSRGCGFAVWRCSATSPGRGRCGWRSRISPAACGRWHGAVMST